MADASTEAQGDPGSGETAPGLREFLNFTNATILSLTLIAATSTYLVAPFLILYFHKVLGFSIAASGFLSGLQFIASIVFGLAGGYLSDRLGLLRSYTLASLVSGVAIAAVGIVHNYYAIGVLMIIVGMMGSMRGSGLQGLGNILVRPEHRGAMQNYLYWTGNVGAVVGLMLSALALSGGASPLPFYVLGALRLILAGGAFLALGRKAAEAAQARESEPQPTLPETMKKMGNDHALLYACGTLLFVMLCEAQLDGTVPLALTHSFQNGSRLLGPLLAINAVMVVACQPLAMKYLATRNPVLVFLGGAVVQGVGFAIMGLGGSVAAWVVGMALYGAGEVAWCYPFNNLAGRLPAKGSEATYFSAIGMVDGLAMFLGITFGPIAYANLGRAVLFAGLVVPCLLAAWCFSAGTRALRHRVLWENANAEVVAEAPSAAAAEAAAAVPERATLSAEGAAAFRAPRDARGEAAFLIPAPADKVHFLQELSEAYWKAVLDYAEARRFAAGDMVLVAGDVDRSVYIVTEGELEVLVGNAAEPTRLTLIRTHSIFGEQAFVDGQPRSASIRAVADGEVRRLTWESFETMRSDHPELARAFMADLARILSERLRRTTAYVDGTHAA